MFYCVDALFVEEDINRCLILYSLKLLRQAGGFVFLLGHTVGLVNGTQRAMERQAARWKGIMVILTGANKWEVILFRHSHCTPRHIHMTGIHRQLQAGDPDPARRTICDRGRASGNRGSNNESTTNSRSHGQINVDSFIIFPWYLWSSTHGKNKGETIPNSKEFSTK